MSVQTKILQGQLTVSEVMSREMLTVPLGTRLGQVAKLLSGGHSRHVLVTDHDGSLVGVISDHDLVRHIADASVAGAAGLEGRTVESAMATKFVSSSPEAHADDLVGLLADGPIQCLPILEGGKLVGVMTSGDLLLSWNRLQPVLQQASTDPITGLANRATFDRRLTEELARARRQHSPLTLALFDVDHFKSINDACGHLTGDAVLRMTASCLSRHLREYDVVARFGGDEFAALCSGCGASAIDAPIRRIQQAIRSLSVPLDSSRRSVTLSIGCAVLRGGCEVTPCQLIQAADECLYEAKAGGRNRSCSIEIGEDGHPRLFPSEGPPNSTVGLTSSAC